jgi:hypothetical protein
MYKAFTNTSLFTLTYLICLIPTYYSAYAGMTENATLSAPAILYLLSMLGIWGICLIRGAIVGKHWLVLIPTVAFIFNLTPALTAIPIVPYAYHFLAILLGAALPSVALTPADGYEMR